MAKTYLHLQHSEGVVILAASHIYSAYIAAGRVPEGQENRYLERSIHEALRIAKTVENNVVAEGEMDG